MLESDTPWISGAPVGTGEQPASLAAMVHAVAKTYPEETALVYQDESLTYRELDESASAVAAAVIDALGSEAASGAIIGLLAPRGTAAIIGLIGVMRAGAAYLPFDGDQPPERIAFMLEDAGASLLIDGGTGLAISAPGTRRLDLDEALKHRRAERLPEAGPGDAAYVIYTSGSTGRPKGVVIEHRGAVNLGCAYRDLFGLRPGDRGLLFASLTFDASVADIFSVMASGATLVIAGDAERRDPHALVALLARERVNVATLPPSLLPRMPMADLPDLRLLVVAGETCAAREMARWAAGRKLINAYGPTEASVAAATWLYEPGGTPTCIGGALPGVNHYVLDETGMPVPVGGIGELYIGGIGVARGYLRRPELTRERFLDDDRFGGDRVFRTGDLVRRVDAHRLDYRGRLDDQVKIAGHRIEPDEVARSLEHLAGVRQACVVIAEDEQGRRILAFYVPENPAKPPRSLDQELARWLPAVMLPADYVAVSSLPLTNNGKIDRAVLLKEYSRPKSEPAQPLTSVEQAVGDIWCELLGLSEVRPSDNFYALGGDSLRMTELLLRLNQQFGTALVPNRFRRLKDLAALAAHVERRQAPSAAK